MQWRTVTMMYKLSLHSLSALFSSFILSVSPSFSLSSQSIFPRAHLPPWEAFQRHGGVAAVEPGGISPRLQVADHEVEQKGFPLPEVACKTDGRIIFWLISGVWTAFYIKETVARDLEGPFLTRMDGYDRKILLRPHKYLLNLIITFYVTYRLI